MADVNASAVMHGDQLAEVKSPAKNQGTMKSEGKEHTLFPFAETESVSQGVSEFLSEINEQPELPETILSEHDFTEITQETIEIETEIQELQEELSKSETLQKGEVPKEAAKGKPAQLTKSSEAKPGGQSQPQQSAEKPVVYSSLFSLAQSFNKGLAEGRKTTQPQQMKQAEAREESRPQQRAMAAAPKAFMSESMMAETHHDKQEQDKEKDEEQKEGSGQHDQQQQQEEQKKRREVFNIKGARSVSKPQAAQGPIDSNHSNSKANETLGSIDNIYIRFMALMARILGQAEAEAHDLYMRIKERTDSIDHLTLLISKINSEKGAIDWTKDEEMKQLIEKARALGVDIPDGKLKWSEDEKKLLKENIQMRKDSMEKVTQLERTDMQRYLQEASQCHQARSNVLKLLKEVMDTIIHNMRP